MKIRTGRRNKHSLYIQFGDEPSDDDRSIGYIADPELAKWLCHEVQFADGSCRRLEAIVTEGRKDWWAA